MRGYHLAGNMKAGCQLSQCTTEPWRMRARKLLKQIESKALCHPLAASDNRQPASSLSQSKMVG